MELSRRSFLKRGLILGTTPVAAGLASTAAMAASSTKKPYKLANVQEYFNICCYCAGGCGTIVSNRNGELINIEGDPDHPVNLGGLCPKGATLWGLRQVVTPDRKVKPNPNRFLYPMVRRPGSKMKLLTGLLATSRRPAMKPLYRPKTATPLIALKASRFLADLRSTMKNAGCCRSSAVRSALSRLTTRRVFATRQRLRVLDRRLDAAQ